MTDVNRRRALMGGLGMLAAGAVGARGVNAAAAETTPFFARNRLPIGLQLYTLGGELGPNLDAGLAQLAGIGVLSVESAGYLGRTPAAFRTALDRAGLRCPSAHIPAQARGPDEASLERDVPRVIEDAHALGCAQVVMPMFYLPTRLDPRPRAGETFSAALLRVCRGMTEDDWKFNAAFLNDKGARLKAAGLRLAYHNHNPEFRPLDGVCGMDVLLRETDPDLVAFEMDVGWVAAAGQDPISWLKAHPGRFKALHVKDLKTDTVPNFEFKMDPTEIGSGSLDWRSILPAAKASGVEQYFIEQEPPFPGPRFNSVRRSVEYLTALVC